MSRFSFHKFLLTVNISLKIDGLHGRGEIDLLVLYDIKKLRSLDCEVIFGVKGHLD